jgi:hypothetical protein
LPLGFTISFIFSEPRIFELAQPEPANSKQCQTLLRESDARRMPISDRRSRSVDRVAT